MIKMKYYSKRKAYPIHYLLNVRAMFRELDSTVFCILLRTSLDRAPKILYRHLAPWTTLPQKRR